MVIFEYSYSQHCIRHWATLRGWDGNVRVYCLHQLASFKHCGGNVCGLWVILKFYDRSFDPYGHMYESRFRDLDLERIRS